MKQNIRKEKQGSACSHLANTKFLKNPAKKKIKKRRKNIRKLRNPEFPPKSDQSVGSHSFTQFSKYEKQAFLKNI